MAPESLPDDVPPDVDITLTKYQFGRSEWDNSPLFISCGTPEQREHFDQRESQDAQYKLVGNAITWWVGCITLGYCCIYDDCFQFDLQWSKMRQDIPAKHKFIWYTYKSISTSFYQRH
jgi:hypothetical protein